MKSNFIIKHPTLETGYRFWLDKISSTHGLTSLDYYNYKQSVDKKKVDINLCSAQMNQFKQMSKENELASYIIIMSIINILLYKYHRSSTNTIIVPGLEDQKSLSFLIVDINDNDTFRTLLNRTKNELQSVYSHDDFPLELFLQEDLNQTIYNYSNIACSMHKPNKHVLNNEHMSYVFTVSFHPDVNIQLFHDSTIQRSQVKMIIRHFKAVLNDVLSNADIMIKDIDILDDEDKRIAYNQHHEQATYNEKITIPEVFSHIAKNNPTRTAVIFNDRKVTYKDINTKANQIAHFLRSKGIERDDLVGVYFERSIEMIISILGVLKSGAAYVPLDSTHPDERIRLICEESDLKYIITENDTDLFEEYGVPSIQVSSPEITNEVSSEPALINQSNDLAYVMFTSGSTGTPKGVMIEHRNVIRLLINDRFEFEFNENDVWSMFHSHCFDFSVWEIFGAFFNASTLLIVPKELTVNHSDLWEYMNQHHVTVFSQTPHSFYQFIKMDELKNNRELQSLRYVIFGGEELHPEKLLSFHQKYPDTKLINMYGITETTVHVTYKSIEIEDMKNKYSNIGVPLSTLKVFILDEANNFLPIGIIGEICVSGSGLARGYLNNDELTKEKFVETGSEILGKIYKTGDLGRLLPNGEIEYIGRKDFQVNVRGYRVELGEIEMQLSNIPEVQESVVDVEVNDHQEKKIVAYYVADKELSIDLLRTKLQRVLPDYMIPSQFKKVDYIPLNNNGKVDKQKLKQLTHDIETSGKEADDFVHQILVEIWQDILGEKTVYIDDNFYEIGGDSIKAIQIISQLKKYNYEANVHDLLNNPTIEDFSHYIEEKSINFEDHGRSVDGDYHLTPIQQEFFHELQGDDGPNYYNQAVMVYRKDGFDPTIVKRSFDEIMKHHDNLRTIFEKKQNEMHATIRPYRAGQYNFDIYNFHNEGEYDKRITEVAIKTQASLDIFKGPLIRLVLFHTNKGDHLLFVVHHLLIDGYSWRVILEDFQYIYDQLSQENKVTLQNRTTSFQEWSKKLYEYANGDKIQDSITYWNDLTWYDKLFPVDYSCPNNVVKNTFIKTIKLDKHQTKLLLHDANHAFNTKTNEILITALGLAISEYFNRKDETIALESHGRDHSFDGIDVSRTVGWFTSIFPFQLYANNNDIKQSIIVNKDNLRRITPRSHDFLLNKYINKNIKDVKPFTKTPSICFNYLGQFDREVNTDLFSLSDISFGNTSGDSTLFPYQLDINCMVINHTLRINLSYIKGSISEEHISHFGSVFLNKINNCIDMCMNRKVHQPTPSDYSYKELSVKDLEHIMDQVNKI